MGVIHGPVFASHLTSCARRETTGIFTITLLLGLSGLTLPVRVFERHPREPRVGGTMLAPNFARIDAERLKNEVCSIRRGPLGRAAALGIAARHGSRLEVRPFVASRDLCTRRLAHALDLPRDHPRTRQALPERLDETIPRRTSQSSLPVERPLGPARAISFRIVRSGGALRCYRR